MVTMTTKTDWQNHRDTLEEAKALRKAKGKRWAFRVIAVSLLSILVWKYYVLGTVEGPKEFIEALRFVLALVIVLVLANAHEHWKDG